MERTVAVAARPRGRPRQEEAAEIDAALLDAALREFVEKGFDKASMRSIAAAANVHRSTLLGRYDRKEDLFQAIMTQQITQMAAATSLEFIGKPDLRAGLVAYANRALSCSLEGDYLEINRLVYASASRVAAVSAAAEHSFALGVSHISEFIRRCAEADGIACKAPEAVAECFTLLLRGWYGYAIIGDRPATAAAREAFVNQMVDVLLTGRANW